ncbi:MULTISPECIES: LysR family transcriptional regulator [unclassified Salinivibrio]|uniref:LysR family transcriptional regulator n=1 Tax=unclassified Salinivibrio TaxID=2636825 RepID=UPI0006148D99|nr:MULTISPECIES: LysR family transcriptional regulator [unclassified Salinivibrio]KKA46212.1 LysR family transcriptional regulator [Salinivibrio sp. KP-1]OOE80914.1 LysR family transcriptional regulator [Salinivibrio sp. ML198]
MQIPNIDVTSLYILKYLLEEKHVSNTALLLNTSQSSVSRALQKMRIFFDDELLVRTSFGFALTPKAEDIKQDISSLIINLEKLSHKNSFEPEKVAGTVRFYGLQPQINTLMPDVVAAIRERAPNLIVSIDTSPQQHFEKLAAGDIHFSLSSHEPPTSEQSIHRKAVAQRDFRLLMNRNHPLANMTLTAENLSQCNFGQISLQGEKTLSLEHKFIELGLANKKRRLSTPIQITNFSSAPNIAAQTDIIFHLPTPFAQAACHDERLITREVPELLQLHFSKVYLCWHKRFHDDPMCVWIRELFDELFDSTTTYS